MFHVELSNMISSPAAHLGAAAVGDAEAGRLGGCDVT
jgi:hypothetical protein